MRLPFLVTVMVSLAVTLSCGASDSTDPGATSLPDRQGKIAFLYFPPTDPDGALGIADVDGTKVVRVAPIPPFAHRFHNLSPAADFVVLHEGLGNDVAAYVIDKAGVKRRLVAVDVMAYSIYPRVSHDGRWVYFAGRNSPEGVYYAIYRVHPDGTGIERITTPTETSRSHTQPASSPDGTKLAFHDEQGLHVLTMATGASITISQLGEHPVFSPDGRRIAYFETGSIVVANVDGTDKRILEDETDQSQVDQRPSWLPSGQILARSIYGAESIDPVSGAKTLVPALKPLFEIVSTP